jgi:precorrin-6B methylase 2
MSKDYSVENTTKVQREKMALDALAISTLDAPEPTDETKKLVQQYIDGNMEIDEVLKKTIERYKVAI